MTKEEHSMFSGNKLKKLRLRKKLSHTDLVFELDKIGLRVSRPTIVNWEDNVTTPRADDLAILAKYFKVSMEYFFASKLNQTS